MVANKNVSCATLSNFQAMINQVVILLFTVLQCLNTFSRYEYRRRLMYIHRCVFLLVARPMYAYRSSMYAHRSSIYAHRSSMYAHRWAMYAYRCSIYAYRWSMYAHRGSMYAHRYSMSRRCGLVTNNFLKNLLVKNTNKGKRIYTCIFNKNMLVCPYPFLVDKVFTIQLQCPVIHQLRKKDFKEIWNFIKQASLPVNLT